MEVLGLQEDRSAAVRVRTHVSGTVQGVGFRPFVWREASSRGLSGWVGNDPSGVVLEIEGAPHAVASFHEALRRPPPLARVQAIRSTALPACGGVGFAVRASDTSGARSALVSPDTATCAECLTELCDPADRRYAYPFVNCTDCGPRFTIVDAVPYDRSRTTMVGFPMCPACQAEYDDPADRRFHAEATCCPACGPALALIDACGAPLLGEPVARAADLLRSGAVLAVKGLGGYHLAVDATQEAAVARLRSRKHREHRPFALMVADESAAAEMCLLDDDERELLMGTARPIVLLRRRTADGMAVSVAESVAPGAPTLGVMLPYTPVHVLLLKAFGRPLVLTSGNASEEPITFDDADALDRLRDIADACLLHDRPIRTRVDDSVTTVVRGRVLPLRRSRGQVPNPIRLPAPSTTPVLACGSALKNTFCITRAESAFVSHHVGDLDDYATFRSYVDGIEHLQGLLDVEPQVLAHDLHPDYPSTRYAVDRGVESGLELIGVQHHHAHIASCLADNGMSGPVIGVAFDGLGWGTDGTAWGGEFLVADLTRFHRLAALAPVPMPGGDAATRQPWRMAAAHLDAAYDGDLPAGLDVALRQGARWEQVLSVARTGRHAPLTSSAGRLFDAVAALLGIRDVVGYEGQAAIELEHVADPLERGSYPVDLSATGSPSAADTEGADVARVPVGQLVRAVVDDLARGTAVPTIAARFHNALSDVVLQVCSRIGGHEGLSTVALSGGVFQNALLVTRCLERLEPAGFTVLTHREVPPNDGGISLGQAAVTTAQLRERR